MKQVSILSGRCLVVEMPEGAETIHLAFNDGFWHLIYFTYHGEILTRKRMPSGRWQIVGMLSEVTEEEAAGLVEPNGNGDYRNYVGAWGGFATAIQSLDSAILAEGGKELDLKRCILLAKEAI